MSEKPKKLLVPVELNEAAAPVLSYAYFIAESFGAAVDLVHVWEPPRYVGYDVMISAGDHTQKLIEAIEAEAKAGLHALLKETPAPTGLQVNTVLRSGFAANVIIETCEEGDYDMIVMGTHGRSGLQHLLVGSVAERTARFADVPVVIVPTGRG
ncbi:MAG: universal stress protein [Myxococcota bacterium]